MTHQLQLAGVTAIHLFAIILTLRNNFFNMKYLVLAGLLLFSSGFKPMFAQNNDSLMAVSFFNEALSSSFAYESLIQLCTIAPGRLAGTPEAATALQFTESLMREIGFDTVYQQPCMVRKWIRGEEESAWFILPDGSKHSVSVDALGGSVPTPENGILANVIAFNSIEEMQKADPTTVKGKIVFFNRPMNNTYYNTFRAYGENASMRVLGADEAAKLGAVAVIVRSLNTETDTFPHTGIMRYKTAETKIPGFAISTVHADSLTQALMNHSGVKVFLKCACREYEEVPSYNVIGEIRGTVSPEKYIVVGGHIDAWYNSQGAHDDGAGCIQSIEAGRLFLTANYRPRNTIRVVMFLDEEMEQRGGRAYAASAMAKGEQHVFGLESDRGAGVPLGFSIDATEQVLQKVKSWSALFEPYGVHMFFKGGSGVDIGFLKPMGVPLDGLVTESQRYFAYHHSAYDTWDQVNRREMQLGSATMALIIYLVDQHGLQ